MSLRLVLGPANAAKAGELLGAFAAAAPRGALLVVPTSADVRHYARELAGDGLVFARVVTFPGLIGEVAERAGLGARPLSALQRERILRRAIAATELGTLEAAAGAPGFAAALGGFVAELGRALVTPQRFTVAMRAWAAEVPARAGYAEDLGALYRGYASQLARTGAVDGELLARRALDALRARPSLWGSTPVFLYGFDDLSALQRDAVETLSRVVGAEVSVSLTHEPSRPALASRARTVEELRPLATDTVELPALDEHYAPAARAALSRLERRLFEPVAEPEDPGEHVRLLEAGGERAEAELIAAEALALIRAGTAPSEIVIVCRSIERSGPLLASVLARCGVPVSHPHRRRLAHTALGRGLLALVRCALADPVPDAAELLRYLRTTGVLEPEHADALAARALREGVRGAGELRERLGLSLGELDAVRRASDPLAEALRQGRRLLAAPRRRRAPVLEGAAEADARAVAALGTAAAELAELGETLDGEELIELLETLTFDEPTTAEERVLIAEPLGIRARRFKAVFVCGLCDRELPRPSAPEPFLSDAARAELARASGLRLAAHEEWLESERFLFYTSVSRATERLVLSYRSSDEDGNLVLPSPFLADVRALLGEDWFARRRRRLLAEVTFPPADAPTERERRRAQAACSGAAAAGAARATGAVAAPERVLGPRAMAHVRHREVVSAGALEAFADCPVAWLVDAQLAPAALEPEPEPLVRGTVVHDVLEATLRRLGGPLTPASLPAARRLLDEALDGLAAERGESLAPGRSEALRAAVVRGIRADLHRYLSHEAASGRGFRPRALELRFGFDGEPDSLPALELGDDGDPVRLRGVIDRVDADPGGTGAAMVIDYKSGATRPEHQAVRWRSEHRLQVGLYMLVVRDLLGLDPVAGVYQPLRGRELRPRGVHSTHAELGDGLFSSDAREPDELGELLDGVRADAAAIAARLREGVLEPCPQTCSRDGCRYPGICRSS